MRLIDADVLVNTLKGLRALTNILSGSRERLLMPFDDMVRMVEKSPTIDPVRKGKWIPIIDNNGQHFICDHCGEWRYHQNQKFCGECGYIMEEGEQE